ncbi:MAG: hypothetical protein HYZ73_05745 [Elusimicrobia bacterium]|nr:hypothetical protein [Elusimicrobiota bacterium]
MSHKPLRLLAALLLIQGVITAVACHSTAFINYPLATGSHKFIDIGDYLTKERKHTVVIWANHPAVIETIANIERQSGKAVIDPAAIEELVNEQKAKFNDLTEDEVVLRAGRLARADSVIFAKAAVTPASGSTDGSGPYNCSVGIRAVNVEIGEVRWTGTAWFPRPVQDPEEALRVLTATAIARARCPIERGFVWYDGKGCLVK